MYHRDGSRFWISINIHVVRDIGGNILYLEGTNQNITERKRAEEALKKSEKQYRELVENASSIILRMDTHGTVTFFNEHALEFLEFSKDEIIGRNVVGTIVPSTDIAGKDLAQMILEIGIHPERYKSNENENRCKDGTWVWGGLDKHANLG